MLHPYALLIVAEFAKKSANKILQMHFKFPCNDTLQTAGLIKNNGHYPNMLLLPAVLMKDRVEFNPTLVLMVGRLYSLGTFITLPGQNPTERSAEGLPAFDNWLELER